MVGEFKLNEPVSNNMMGGQKNFKHEPTSGGFDSFNNKNSSMGEPHLSYHEVKLENLCEKNCPKLSSVSQQAPAQVVQSAPAQTAIDRKNQTLKQRINSLVIKTLAENLEKDKHSMGSLQNPQNNRQDWNAVMVCFSKICYDQQLKIQIKILGKRPEFFV